MLLTALLFLAAALSFISDSPWLISIALTALLVKLYPVLLVLLAAGGGGFLLLKYLKR
jgi:hypothetical protein